jgi:hypothetical protein
MKASVEVICYKVRPLKNGEYPLMLRITKSRKRKYVSTGLSIDSKFWDFSKNKPRRNCPNKEQITTIIEQKTQRYLQQITEYKAEERDYTLNSLVQRVENPIIKHSFGSYLDQYTHSLIIEKRLGYSTVTL